jgi:hypothetical protein
MRELSSVLRQHAFHLLLLIIAVIVFCKPMFLATESESPARVVLELFIPWALVVLVLFLIARSSDEPPEPEDAAEEEPERD